MTTKYPIAEPQGCYFVTLDAIDRVDIFIRPFFKQIIVESLNYFIEKKGLIVYGWCLMSNHLHLVAEASDGGSLASLVNDFKTFTAKLILEDLNNEAEIRRNWIIKKIKEAALFDKLEIWEKENHPQLLTNADFDSFDEHIRHIHNNPVRNKIVALPEDYLHSSARNYAGLRGLVNIQYTRQNEPEVSFYKVPSRDPMPKNSEYFSY